MSVNGNFVNFDELQAELDNVTGQVKSIRQKKGTKKKTRLLVASTDANDNVTGIVDPKTGAPIFFGGVGYTWATRPSAAGNVGQTIRITDIGNSAGGAHFFSDGTNWRPVGGSILLASKAGSLSSPLNVISGTTAAYFTPNVTIPAGLLIAGESHIDAQCLVRRVGANGTANLNIIIGTSGVSGDANVFASAMSATNNLDMAPSPIISVSSATKLTTTAFMQVGSPSGSSAATDVTAQVNIAADMKLTFTISAANALDSFNLIAYRVRVYD